MRLFVRYVTVFAAFMTLTIGVIALAAEDTQPSMDDLLQKRLAPFEEEGPGVVEGSIAAELNFVTTVFLAGGMYGNEYYKGLLRRWEECATEESLPAMERFIKRCARFKQSSSGRLPWAMFSTLDKGVQELWFKVKTKGMTDEDKAKIALYGFMGEDAPVPLDTTLCTGLLGELGEDARAPVYRFLENSANDKEAHLISASLGSLPAGLCGTEVYQPTKKEIDRFLASQGTLGQMVMVDYLVKYDDAAKALEPLLTMARSAEYAVKTRSLFLLRSMEEYRDKIIPVLVEEGRKDLLVSEKGTPWGRATTDTLRRSTFGVLRSMGKDPRTVALFLSYVKNNGAPETWAFLSTEALETRQSAMKEAIDALKEWNEWPVE